MDTGNCNRRIVLLLVLIALMLPMVVQAREPEYLSYKQCRFTVRDGWRRAVGTAWIQASVKWETKVKYTYAYGYAIGRSRRNWFYYDRGWRNYATAMLNVTGYGWGSRTNNFRMRVYKDGTTRCFQW